MQKIKQNGKIVSVNDKTVIVNGESYPKPKSKFGSTVEQINGDLWVNGCKFNGDGFDKPSKSKSIWSWFFN